MPARPSNHQYQATTPVRSHTQRVVDELGLAIVSSRQPEGSLLPGDGELLERYRVSRTVLREAFKTLAAKGMVQAKARIMARNAGLEMPVDDDLHEALDEREFLRRSIGPTGLLALKPLQVTSDRDDWHRYLLSQANVRARIKGRLRNPRRK